MRIRIALAILGFELVTSCAGSCTCGEAGPPPVAPSPAGSVSAKSAAGAAAPRPALGGASSSLDARFHVMPESPLRGELQELAAPIDVQAKLGVPLAPSALGAVLPTKLGGFSASTAPTLSTSQLHELRIPVAVREYTSGKRKARIKITDTAELPQVRREIAEQVVLIGNEVAGNQQGIVLHGAPGVFAYHAEVLTSRASLLVTQRYLVEVIVRDTKDPRDAVRVIEAMSLSAFAAGTAGPSKRAR